MRTSKTASPLETNFCLHFPPSKYYFNNVFQRKRKENEKEKRNFYIYIYIIYILIRKEEEVVLK